MIGTHVVHANALHMPIVMQSGMDMVLPASQSAWFVDTFDMSSDDYERVVASDTPWLPYLGWYFATDMNLRFLITATSVSNPLIEGTNIPAYRVAALLAGGVIVDEILRDFPSLTRGQVESTRAYTKVANNETSRYPGISLKKLLRDSGSYELDKELKELRKKARVAA